MIANKKSVPNPPMDGTGDALACTRSRVVVIAAPILITAAALLLLTCETNVPPVVWTHLAPDMSLSSSTFLVRVTVVDPQEDSVAVRIAWGDGDTSNWSAFTHVLDTISMSHAWTGTGRFFYGMQAQDKHGALSDWDVDSIVVLDTSIVKWVTYAEIGGDDCLALGPDGTVYGTGTNEILALASDGTLKWSHPVYRVTPAPAVGLDGTIYVNYWHIYALTPDGDEKWHLDSTEFLYSSGLAIGADGTIYQPADTLLIARSPDGSVIWSHSASSRILTSPIIATDGTIYAAVGTDQKIGICAIRPDGSGKWFYPSTHKLTGIMALDADGTIYAPDQDDGLIAVSADGTPRWRYYAGGRIRGSPVVTSDGLIIFAVDGKGMTAVYSAGSPKWQYPVSAGTEVKPPALAADGTVYFGTSDDSIHALNSDGSAKWAMLTERGNISGPTIAPDGTVYIQAGPGSVYALKGSYPLASSPWPKYQHDAANTGRTTGSVRTR